MPLVIHPRQHGDQIGLARTRGEPLAAVQDPPARGVRFGPRRGQPRVGTGGFGLGHRVTGPHLAAGNAPQETLPHGVVGMPGEHQHIEERSRAERGGAVVAGPFGLRDVGVERKTEPLAAVLLRQRQGPQALPLRLGLEPAQRGAGRVATRVQHRLARHHPLPYERPDPPAQGLGFGRAAGLPESGGPERRVRRR